MYAPKGLKWWYKDDNLVDHIRDDAPQWAKDEFKEYFELLNDPNIDV